MTSAMSFLAVPIKARVASDGRLLSADPPIWRLHSWAGGDDGGVLAIPSLAALAALAIKTGMRVERAVRAADEDTDVELWAEATADKQHADLLVTGWRDVSNSAPAERTESLDTAAAPSHEIWIDAEHRIVRLPSFLPHHAIGQHFGALFIIQSDAEGRIPVIEALSKRSAIHDAPVSVHSDSTAYRLNLTPQFAADGAFIGHGGTVHPQAEAMQGEAAPGTAGSADTPVPASELPMSRQLASVLKQPLDRIVANAETIGSKVYGPLRDNYAEYAQDIANAARHLAELVSDMEDLDAIDRPDFSVARDRIELGDVARRVAGLLALKASDHSIRLVVPSDDQHVPAIGEFRRVLQIMLNLVGNAIRYAPGGSMVTIAIEKEGEVAAVSISDEGQGVAEEDRQRVFEKFERLGRSGDGGSGLGLYISRKLARAMGGDLQVLDAPGGGARFQLTLPAR